MRRADSSRSLVLAADDPAPAVFTAPPVDDPALRRVVTLKATALVDLSPVEDLRAVG
jgi:hypothetical protein